MPRTRKVCPICGKKGLLKLSNHLANVHKLSALENEVGIRQCRPKYQSINLLGRQIFADLNLA